MMNFVTPAAFVDGLRKLRAGGNWLTDHGVSIERVDGKYVVHTESSSKIDRTATEDIKQAVAWFRAQTDDRTPWKRGEPLEVKLETKSKLTLTRTSNAFAAISSPGRVPVLDQLLGNSEKLGDSARAKCTAAGLEIETVNAQIVAFNKGYAEWQKSADTKDANRTTVNEKGATLLRDLDQITGQLTAFLTKVPQTTYADDKDPQWRNIIDLSENNVNYVKARNEELDRNNLRLSTGARRRRRATPKKTSKRTTHKTTTEFTEKHDCGCAFCGKGGEKKLATSGCGCAGSRLHALGGDKLSTAGGAGRGCNESVLNEQLEYEATFRKILLNEAEDDLKELTYDTKATQAAAKIGFDLPQLSQDITRFNKIRQSWHDTHARSKEIRHEQSFMELFEHLFVTQKKLVGKGTTISDLKTVVATAEINVGLMTDMRDEALKELRQEFQNT